MEISNQQNSKNACLRYRKFLSLFCHPETLFLVIGFFFGIILLFKTPIFQVPDEPMHLLRACEVSAGVLHNNKNGNISKDIFSMKKFNVKEKCSKFQEFREIENYSKLFEFKNLSYTHNNTGYSFILYLPQATGIWISSFFTENPFIIFYVARFFNFVVWLALIYFSIKLTPLKWAFLVTALFPMTLYEGMSLSADSFNLGFSFLYVALILNLAFGKEKFVSKQKLFFLVSMSVLSIFLKGTIILSLLMFLIPKSKFKHKYLIAPALILFCFALQIAFSFNTFIFINTGIDVHERKLLILNSPFYVLKVLAKTLIYKTPFYIKSAVFELGWLNINPNPIFVILLYIAYFLTPTLDKVKEKLYSKFFAIVTNFIFIILTLLLYFITFTPLDKNIIYGAQGRYFIPLFLSFALVMQTTLNLPKRKTIYIKFAILIILLSALICAVILV